MGKLPWLRLYTELLDDPKMRDFTGDEFRDWIFLLCLARESSEPGTIFMSVEDTAWRLRRPVDEFRRTLEKCASPEKGMIEVYDDRIVLLNFASRQYDCPSDHPSAVSERVRRCRDKARRDRDKEKRDCNDSETPCNARDRDSERDPDSERESEEAVSDETVSTAAPCDDIVSLYNSLCTSLPRVQTVTEKRKKTIKTRWKKHHDLSTYRQLFSMAEASDFLSGRNGKWTSCNFDWLLKEPNMVKVLEGAYDNRASPAQFRGLRNWAEKEGVFGDKT